MNASAIAATLGGIFAGMFGFQLITRGMRLLYALLGKSTGEPKRLVPAKRLWAIPLLLLYPGTWVPVAIAYLSFAVYTGRVGSVWGWFLSGVLLGIAGMCAVVLNALRRIRRKLS
jgi:hypothetical protein